MGKVKTGSLRVDQGAFLNHMVAQHIAQGLVHQMGRAVVAHGRVTHGNIHRRGHAVTHIERALGDGTLVTKHIGLDLLGIAHFKASRAAGENPHVAHLPTALGVKRGCV